MLNTADKRYINSAIKRSHDNLHTDVQKLHTNVQKLHTDVQKLHTDVRSIRTDIKKDFDHTLGLYLDQMKHEHQLTRELIETRPSKDEVRDIIRQEVKPFALWAQI